MKYGALFVLFFNLLNFFWIIKHVEAKLVAAGIVGGNIAKLGQFKYQVSVQIDNVHYCGGGIIGEKHILTAAHCVVHTDGNFIKGYFSVVAGSINAQQLGENAVRARVEYAYVPIEYNNCDYDVKNNIVRVIGDIAVLKLETRLDLQRTSTLVKLILPKVSNVYSTYKNTNPIVAGFGLENVATIVDPITKEKEEIPVDNSYNLKYSKTLVIANDICIDLYKSPILPSHICAQVDQNFLSKKGRGICKGDSGSPLVLNDNTVIGVVSTGPIGCDEREDPSIYTRVTHFLPFINFCLNDIELPNIRVFKYNLEME